MAVTSTIPFPTSGKWYMEVECISKAVDQITYFWDNSNIYGTAGEGSITFQNECPAGQTLSIAVDRDAETVTSYFNNVQSEVFNLKSDIEYFFFLYDYQGGDYRFNFGQKPWTYQTPAGFLSLNTKNLP